MTSIFQAMSGQPEMFDEYANRMLSTEPKIKFSNVFSPFFGNISSNICYPGLTYFQSTLRLRTLKNGYDQQKCRLTNHSALLMNVKLTNFVIFQTIGPEKMIDWGDVNGTKPGEEQRQNCLAKAFYDILDSPESHRFSDYFLTIKGREDGSDGLYLLNVSPTVTPSAPCA
ncbi:unnamed protein product [Orchesella dallaii]|uniref:Uncharacterized protein n=1 Tax=Orchesella dallaii TaxID=48710 RepID=A0ABP1RQK3_9HEXA